MILPIGFLVLDRTVCNGLARRANSQPVEGMDIIPSRESGSRHVIVYYYPQRRPQGYPRSACFRGPVHRRDVTWTSHIPDCGAWIFSFKAELLDCVRKEGRVTLLNTQSRRPLQPSPRSLPLLHAHTRHIWGPHQQCSGSCSAVRATKEAVYWYRKAAEIIIYGASHTSRRSLNNIPGMQLGQTPPSCCHACMCRLYPLFLVFKFESSRKVKNLFIKC